MDGYGLDYQMNDELYQFLACDYYATGEGRTVMLLITRAYPRTDDYEDVKIMPPKVKKSAKFRAAREFAEEFGGYFLQGAVNLPREEFLTKFGHHLPGYVHDILEKEGDERPGNFNYKMQMHMNFS